MLHQTEERPEREKKSKPSDDIVEIDKNALANPLT